MFSRLKKVINSRLINVPVVGDSIQKSRIQRVYADEVALLQGDELKRIDVPSIINFSLNKAATQYIKNILVCYSEDIGLKPIALNEYSFKSELPYLHELSAAQMEPYKAAFKAKGFFYGAFSGWVEGIDNIEEYKKIICIRDPRDILVSSYFSLGISHPSPPKHTSKYQDFMSKRELAQSNTLDEFVRIRAEKLKLNYERYIAVVSEGSNNTLVLKYEDMLHDFEGWLNRIISFVGVEMTENLKNDILQKHELSRPKDEDASQHVRKGISGDYKEKLANETIVFCNELFADILEFFDYTK